MRPRAEPGEDLRELLARAWELLVLGAAGRCSGMRTPVLASVTSDGEPDARTVVLWRVEPARRSLYLATDRRSPKHQQLRRRPRGVLVFYDESADVQLRVRARFALHTDGALVRAAWDALPLPARRPYLSPQPPGQPAPRPTSGLPGELERRPLRPEETAPAAGRLAVLEGIADELDYLRVSDSGHRPRRISVGRTGGSACAVGLSLTVFAPRPRLNCGQA